MKNEKLSNVLKIHQNLVEQCKAYLLILGNNTQALTIVDSIKQQIEVASQEIENLISSNTNLNNDSILTKRELEVLELVSKGFLNKEISYQLSISERTVQFHLKSVFTKLEVSSRTEAVTLALKRNIISL